MDAQPGGPALSAREDGRARPAGTGPDIAVFLDTVPPSSRPASVPTGDRYAHLDLEPDFAWQPADGSPARVARLGDDDRSPQWVRRVHARRRRNRLVGAASWLVTACVALGVSAAAALLMIGPDRGRALLGALAAKVSGGRAADAVTSAAVAPVAVGAGEAGPTPPAVASRADSEAPALNAIPTR